jgi:hypothetical protein
MVTSGCIVGAVLVLVLHPMVAMSIVVVIFLIDCVMLGWIPALGMQLHRCELVACVTILCQGYNYSYPNPLHSVTTICTVMAVGVAVDFSVHIAHSFLEAKGSPTCRSASAIKQMFPSLILGAFTTFLGVLPLHFAQVESSRIFFKMMVGVIGSGLLFGLIYLPIMLAVFGSRCSFGKSDSAKIPREATNLKSASPSTPCTTLRRRRTHANRASHVSAALTGIKFRKSSDLDRGASTQTLPAKKTSADEATMRAAARAAAARAASPSTAALRKSVVEGIVWDDQCGVRGTVYRHVRTKGASSLPYENMVFSGGGAMGVAYLGALKAFDEIGCLEEMRRFAGCSAGSLCAMSCALGLDYSRTKELLDSINLADTVRDPTSNCCHRAMHLFNGLKVSYGINTGRWVGELARYACHEVTGNANLTFRELYAFNGRELCVMAVNIETKPVSPAIINYRETSVI